jgi:hypothetical protein
VSDAYPDLEGFDWTCPHCGVMVDLKPQKDLASPHSIRHESFLICQCPRKPCREIVFVVFDTLNNHIQAAYPYSSTSAEQYPKSIPPKIREDMAEAVRCFSVNAYRSVVVMCRRVLQRIASDHQITGGDIKSQTNRMFEAGLITKNLKDAAHEIRHFGGFGAHPQDDDLDNVTRDDALGIWRQVNQFVNNLYVMPAENAELQKRRQFIQQQKPKK